MDMYVSWILGQPIKLHTNKQIEKQHEWYCNVKTYSAKWIFAKTSFLFTAFSIVSLEKGKNSCKNIRGVPAAIM